MKKLLGLFLFVGMTSQSYAGGFVSSFGGSASTSDPTVEYVVLKNGESTSVAKGRLMTLDTSNDDGVTMKLTTTQTTPALCVAAETIAAAAFGKCQTYGYIDTLFVDGATSAVTAGARVGPSVTDGYADGNTTGLPVGIAYDSSSASESIEAFIMLR